MLLLRRTVINDILLLLRQLAKRYIYAHAHLLADIRHQRPHQAVPWCNSALLDGKRFIRHQRADIYRADAACTAAGFAGTLRIEGQLLGRRRIKLRAALRAGQLLACGNQKRRLQIMSVRTAMAGKARIHKAQAVQQLRTRAEGAADSRYTRTLVQRQSCGNIQHLIYRRFSCLRHATACIGRKCLQIAA